MENKGALKWRFDVNTFRLLGRDLITDRITALFELVKNAYDANATRVVITFIDVEKRDKDSKIVIEDNGIGMTLQDIEDKWMVIGTSSKRNQLFSPKPFERRYIGEKGIGRFAVDKIGQYLIIKTKQQTDEKELQVTINWDNYEQMATEKQENPILFTDIENEYEYVEADFNTGTHLEMLLPREIWTYEDINRAEKELSRLVSPFHESEFPFDIYIHAPEYQGYETPKRLETKEREFASHNFKLEFDAATSEQETLFFNKNTQKIEIHKIPKPSFGNIKFYLYYFDADAKAAFNLHYRKTSVNIDGIKIYRDGVLTTPFAEYEAQDEKRRDILGINKRRWRSTFDRVGSRDVIGFIEITRDGNPNILDTTNRQDFLTTKEYSELKDFIYEQLDIFMETYKVERQEKKEDKLSEFQTSKSSLVSIQKEVTKLQKTSDVKKQQQAFEKIQKEVENLTKGFEAISSVYRVSESDKQRREKIFFSLLAQSMATINMGHTVRDSIGKIKNRAQWIAEKNFTDEAGIAFSKRAAATIFEEITGLYSIIDFMLKPSKTNLPARDFNVKQAIENVFEAHQFFLREEQINAVLNLDSHVFITANEVLFKDIITCLISNAIKAIRKQRNRHIQCTLEHDGKMLTLRFSDNGVGIPKELWDWVFEAYNTKTEAQGGVGLGLYIARSNVQGMGGTIKIIDNTAFDIGASFEIRLPLTHHST